ncbi:hypothetical protein [Noviherbaspirillum aerium]|uniref:hypothetical protein n=1 Tax=Noviherbaspirillum aerium TaxID=2588497 RepID=UPI00178C76CE|nr:hypothetical protein [Noviherbaspirillum aerium]
MAQSAARGNVEGGSLIYATTTLTRTGGKFACLYFEVGFQIFVAKLLPSFDTCSET